MGREEKRPGPTRDADGREISHSFFTGGGLWFGSAFHEQKNKRSPKGLHHRPRCLRQVRKAITYTTQTPQRATRTGWEQQVGWVCLRCRAAGSDKGCVCEEWDHSLRKLEKAAGEHHAQVFIGLIWTSAECSYTNVFSSRGDWKEEKCSFSIKKKVHSL